MATSAPGVPATGTTHSSLAILPRTMAAAAELAHGHDHRLRHGAHLDVRVDRPLRYAVEVRHPTFHDPAFLEVLRRAGIALCIADSETRSTPVEITADYAYFRLRDEGYKPSDLNDWAKTIKEKTSACKEVFVYFKHEEAGKGPEFAAQLLKTLATDG